MKKFLFIFFLSISLTNIYAQNNNKYVTAYPNPAKDFLYIKTSDPSIKVKSVTFYSILGTIVADMQINASYSEIKIDKLKQGKYLMKYVLQDNSYKIIPIIKQ